MSPDIVVGMLIAWAARKGGMVATRVDRHTDQVVDAAVLAVLRRLGSDPAVARLVTEAETEGTASSDASSAAEGVVRRAMASDPAFAAELDRAATQVSGAGARFVGGDFVGVQGDVHGSVNFSHKVVNEARRHPVLVAVVLVPLVVAAFLLVRAVTGDSGSPAPGSTAVVGEWTASDGTGTKLFTESGGRCEGFYYSNGEPLDIGGPMTCSISSRADAQGRYTLEVTQSMNEARYLIEFTDSEHAAVYEPDGTLLYELRRF